MKDFKTALDRDQVDMKIKRFICHDCKHYKRKCLSLIVSVLTDNLHLYFLMFIKKIISDK